MKKLHFLKLILLASLLQTCTPTLAQIQIARNYWDLKYSKSYTNARVNAFDSLINPAQGGGEFAWIKVSSNASIIDIPGIQIKSKYNNKGYWRRIYAGPVEINWMGVSNQSNAKWFQYGYSQEKLDSIFGGVLGNGTLGPGNTVDESAMACAFKLMETPGYQAVNFAPRKYYQENWIVFLPRYLNQAGPVDRAQFKITGNGTWINSSATYGWDHYPSTQTEAASWANNGFIISGFTWESTTAQAACIRLCATYKSHISDMTFKSAQKGLVLEWSMGCLIENTEGNNTQIADIWISTGTWSGADYQNSQSNAVTVNQHRSFGSGDYGIYIYECSNVRLNDITIEGGTLGHSFQGIHFDSNGSSLVKDFKCTNIYGEGYYGGAAIYISMGQNGIAEIDWIYFRGTDIVVWFKSNTDSYPQLNMRNVVWWDSPFRMRSEPFAISHTNNCWAFENFSDANATDPSSMASTQYFDTGGGGEVPVAARITVIPKIVH